MYYSETFLGNRSQDIGMAGIGKSDGGKKSAVFLGGALLLIVFALFGTAFHGIKAKGQEQSRYKYYTSIEIQSGDTLWDIASEIAEAYDLDTRECVRELKFMNNMKNDTIHAGNHLTIFYYDDTYK